MKKEDGSVGRRNKDYKEEIFRFLVKRQSLIKKIPIKEQVAGCPYLSFQILTINLFQIYPNS